VLVGDRGYYVTCICIFEGAGEEYTETSVRSFGFEEAGYP
jgi:hypothetical protein